MSLIIFLIKLRSFTRSSFLFYLLQEPVLFEKSKNFCCLWCKSGPLTLTIKLPAGGFVPGQVIPFQIEVENASNIRVHPINCVLRKVLNFLKFLTCLFYIKYIEH